MFMSGVFLDVCVCAFNNTVYALCTHTVESNRIAFYFVVFTGIYRYFQVFLQVFSGILSSIYNLSASFNHSALTYKFVLINLFINFFNFVVVSQCSSKPIFLRAYNVLSFISYASVWQTYAYIRHFKYQIPLFVWTTFFVVWLVNLLPVT